MPLYIYYHNKQLSDTVQFCRSCMKLKALQGYLFDFSTTHQNFQVCECVSSFLYVKLLFNF